MSGESDNPNTNEIEPEEFQEVPFDASQETQQYRILSEEIDPVRMVEYLYHIWWLWADFEISIMSPVFPRYAPPQIINPEKTEEGDELEFVYPIHDSGYKFSASKGEDMFTAGMSMHKMHLTIEKIIYLVVERLKSQGVDSETEVRVSFGGHELCQRKAFESIINLNFNLVVTNFDPGTWGENYLANVKRLAEKGYGYPSESPRDNFRHSVHTTHKPK